MRWNSKLAITGALGAAVIGGVAMTVPGDASEAAMSGQVTTAIEGVIDIDGHGGGPGFGRGHGHHQRGPGGAAVAEALGIDVETFRDAVRAVIEGRIEAGVEKPQDLTAEEREALRDEFNADLAVELGVSVDDLQAAFDAVFEARLQQGIEDGKLTAEEAQEIRDAKANGTLQELHQERQLESLGDRLEMMLSNGVIDQAQYDALQAELAADDLEGFRELMRDYMDGSGIRPGGHHFRGGPGFGPHHGGDAPIDEGVSL